MSLDNEAPVSTDTASATTDVAASTGTQAAAADSDWRAALDEDTRKTVDAKGWKSPADSVRSYTELFREYTDTKSKALVLPSDDAKPEDWQAFNAKMGVPEKAEQYDFKLPEGLPENFPYDAKSAEEYKNWAHEAGLTPRQAQAVHDKFVQHTAGTLAASAEATAEAIGKAHDALVKTWGDPSSETYKRNQELANRAIRQNGGTELLNELKSVGAMDGENRVRVPHLAVALAKIGQALYAEDTAYGGPMQGPNPFSEASTDMTKQGAIIRSDPDHARALIRSSGQDPKDWGL